jgi:hypothetical protein
MKKNIALFLYGILCATILPAYSQTKAIKYEVILFFEKVYLHTDQQPYAPGNDIWYKA